MAPASPVSPELVALVREAASPLVPEVAVGEAVMLASPPSPPLASAVATLLPPRARTLPPVAPAADDVVESRAAVAGDGGADSGLAADRRPSDGGARMSVDGQTGVARGV